MRNPYTCIFRRTLSTRIWSLSPSTRCVWLWLRLTADPEGFVNADLAGVAAGANVAPEEAKRAIEGFVAPDPDADPDDPRQGRILERVRGGWLILDYEEGKELARTETRNARNAQYARNRRARERDVLGPHITANDAEPTQDIPDAQVAPSRLRSRSTFRSKSSPETGELSPLPPAAAPHERFANEGSNPATLHSLPDDWEPSAELRVDAAIAGITNLDERIASLRTGPIGGNRGVLAHQLEKYIRGFFGKWKAWEQTDRAKAAAEAKRGAAAASGKKPWEAPETIVELDVRYIDSRIPKFIAHHKLGSAPDVIREWLTEATAAGKKLTHAEAQKALRLWLSERAQKARAA